MAEQDATLISPDFEKMAGEFDRHLPLLQPVGDAVLRNLPDLRAKSVVLDVACGTGEPGLTLARRRADIELIGVDAATNMVKVANDKSNREGLTNTKFVVMDAESLDFEPTSVDAVISRFGLLMFGDTARSAHEIARVLAPNGYLSIAVWHDLNLNILVKTVLKVLRTFVPNEIEQIPTRMPGADAAKNLRDVGFREVKSEDFTWYYEFESAQAIKEFVVNAGMFSKYFDKLAGKALVDDVLTAVTPYFDTYRTESGSYRIPHTCKLVWARK